LNSSHKIIFLDKTVRRQTNIKSRQNGRVPHYNFKVFIKTPSTPQALYNYRLKNNKNK